MEVTQLVEQRDLTQWKQHLHSVFGRSHGLTPLQSKRFYGASRTATFGAISAVELITKTPIEIRNGVQRSAAVPLFHIFFIDDGEMRDAAGRLVLPRSMMVVNGQHYYAARQSAHFRSLVLTAPAALLRAYMTDVDDRCGIVENAAHGPARVLHDYAATLLAEADFLKDDYRKRAETHLLELICASAQFDFRTYPPAGLKQHIAAHLADPNLSPTHAARALGMSVRTLHARMATLGTSFAQELREQRLQRCRNELVSGSVRPIGQVAASWGFESPSTFSRLFRQRFGVSPREYVREHCKNAPQ